MNGVKSIIKEVTSREKVLKNIREALTTSVQSPFDEVSRDEGFFRKDKEEISEIRFAEEFKSVGGNFVYCADEKEFLHQISSVMKTYSLQQLVCTDSLLGGVLEKQNFSYVSDVKKADICDCSLTRCEYLITRTGTIMVCVEDNEPRSVYFTAPVHFVLAYTSQLVDDISDALKAVKSKYENIPRFTTFITGPSRTADIEKTLVMGAHGPKELFLFLIDDIA